MRLANENQRIPDFTVGEEHLARRIFADNDLCRRALNVPNVRSRLESSLREPVCQEIVVPENEM
jgi:hypothetical protein